MFSEIQHVRNCPIDCASIYYNGVRRSGLYTVVPSLAGLPVEVYCDMDTDGESGEKLCWLGWRSTYSRCAAASVSQIRNKMLSPPLPFPFRWWLDGDPAACWRLCELRPQLEGVQGWIRRPALGVLAGQRTHTWAEHPGRLQPPHPPGGLEQQAQTRPLPELQVAVMHQLAKKTHAQPAVSLV